MTRAQALVIRTGVVDAGRSFLRRAPDLPAARLPDAWPRRHAYELLQALHVGLSLSEPAEAQWTELTGGSSGRG